MMLLTLFCSSLFLVSVSGLLWQHACAWSDTVTAWCAAEQERLCLLGLSAHACAQARGNTKVLPLLEQGSGSYKSSCSLRNKQGWATYRVPTPGTLEIVVECAGGCHKRTELFTYERSVSDGRYHLCQQQKTLS